MIKPECNRCNEELNEFGGILLSPPDSDDNVKKHHLCKECYNIVVVELGNDTTNTKKPKGAIQNKRNTQFS